MSSQKSKYCHAAADQDAQLRVLRQFRIIFNAVKTHFRQVERDAGIGGAQLWALSLIGATPGIGITELASALDIHQSTASNLVKALLHRQLIEGVRDGLDRRTVSLRILAAGAALLDKAPGPFAGVLPSALSRLDPERLARLEHDLGAVLALLSADERAANTPLAEL